MSILNLLMANFSPQAIFDNFFNGLIHPMMRGILYFTQTYGLSWSNVNNFWTKFPNSYIVLWGVMFALGFVISIAIYGTKAILIMLKTTDSEKRLRFRDLLMSVWGYPIIYSIGFGLLDIYGSSLLMGVLSHIRSIGMIPPSPTTAQLVMGSLMQMGSGGLEFLVGIIIVLSLVITAILFIFDYIVTSVQFWFFGWMSPLFFYMSPFLGDYMKGYMQRMFLIPLEQFARDLIVLFVTAMTMDMEGMILALVLLAIGRHPLKMFGTSSSSDAPVFASVAMVANAGINAVQSASNVGSLLKGGK